MGRWTAQGTLFAASPRFAGLGVCAVYLKRFTAVSFWLQGYVPFLD